MQRVLSIATNASRFFSKAMTLMMLVASVISFTWSPIIVDTFSNETCLIAFSMRHRPISEELKT
eukprot:4587945-Heterocapsa_arctica.AAC.1